MWSNKSIFVLSLLVVAFGECASARTWRPAGQPVLKGEFEDVVGTNVTIRTDEGIKSVAYADLSPTDKAVVKSKLVATGRESDARRLDSGAASSSGSSPLSGIVPPDDRASDTGGGENDERTRTWTDIAGNKVVAEFVGVKGQNVLLRSDGSIQQYPIKAFSEADQEWIATHRVGSIHDMPSGTQSIISPRPPVIPSLPPDRPFMMPPIMPPIAGGDFPVLKGDPGMMPSDDEDGTHSFPSGDWQGMLPPMHTERSAPNDFGGNSAGTWQSDGTETEWTYRCEGCGAEFSADSGVKEGDDCPKCSGNSTSGRSWMRSLKLGRALKGIIMLIVLGASVVGWVVRKAVNGS